MNWIVWEDPEILPCWWPRMSKCKQTRRRKCTCRTLTCSSQCKYSTKRPQFFSLGKLCSEHGYSYEWQNGETPCLTKHGKIITYTMDNFVPLVVPGLKSSSSSRSASTSRTKGQWFWKIIGPSDNSKWWARQRRVDAKRSWEACLGKSWFSERRWDGQGRSNARHSWLVTTLHRQSRGLGDACARTFLWKWELRFGSTMQTWWRRGSTVFTPTHPKTEIATCACGPKLLGFLAEGAVKDLFRVQ